MICVGLASWTLATCSHAQLLGPSPQRDIEQGKDVKFSNLLAVAAALGLKLELVEQVA